MYFEARTHNARPVKDHEEAAKLIKAGEVSGHEVLQWDYKGKTYMVVADGHIDNMFLEVAFIRKEEDGTFTQLESITAGWIKSDWKLNMCFKEMMDDGKFFLKKNVQLIIGKPQGTETAWFTCGCCGEGFTGNIKHQLTFDQDSGYGYCKPCETRYH